MAGIITLARSPVTLTQMMVGRFLTVVPAMHAGDNYSLLFTQSGATITVNGKLIGTITQPRFAEAMLATFLGPKPASPRLKRELLEGHG